MRTRLSRCQLPLMFTCALLPVPLTLASLTGQSLLPWLVSPALYLVIACLSLIIPGKWRLAFALPATVGMVATGYFAMAGENIYVQVVIPVLFAVIMFFTLPIAGWDRGREPPFMVTAGSICIHLLSQFVLFAKPPEMKGVEFLSLASFLAYFVLMLLSMNRQSIANAMPEGHDVPLSIRRRNTLLTWILAGLSVLFSLIPSLTTLVAFLMEWIKTILHTLLQLLLKIFESKSTSEGGGGSSEEELLGGLGGETSPIAAFLEKILIVVSVILLALALLWTVRFLWRKLKQLAAYLYNQLRQYAASAGEDYVDEVTDTREQGGERESLAHRIMRRRSARRNLKDLPPREQVRTLYGLLRGKHPEWADSGTARETLTAEEANIYERARYSSHSITQEDSDAFAQHISR